MPFDLPKHYIRYLKLERDLNAQKKPIEDFSSTGFVLFKTELSPQPLLRV